MTILFNEIPSDLRVPGAYFEIDPTRAVGSLPVQQKKILVLGQRLTTGTVAELVPTLVNSAGQAETYFGRGSMLAAMLAALKKANSYTEVWAIALDDDAAGVRATKTLTFTGPATDSGTVSLYLGGRRVRAAVVSGDSASTVATAVAAAITADTAMEATATVSSAVVTVTYRHKGEAGNSFDVRLNYYVGDALPAGIGCTIAAGATGTANPAIDNALAAMGDEWFTHVVTPYTDAANYTALETELETRWGAMVMKEAMGYAAATGTVSANSTLGSGRNSKTVCTMDGARGPTPPWHWAAVVAAVDAYEPHPRRPRTMLKLPGILPPAVEDRRTLAEQNILLYDGISTHMVDSGGNVLIQQLVTMYQTNGGGVEDTAYLFVTTMNLLAFLRFSRRLWWVTHHPRSLLARNSSTYTGDLPVVTPEVAFHGACTQFREWVGALLVEDDFEGFKAGYRAEISDSDPNRINEVLAPNLINGLHTVAGLLQFRE
jgi:phage tail sheath gpL-like